MYWILSFISTYIAQYHREQILLRFLVKPLPIGLLLVDAYNKDNPLLVWGLLFSAAGDVLLIPSNGVSAALGVVSFFTGETFLFFIFKDEINAELKHMQRKENS